MVIVPTVRNTKAQPWIGYVAEFGVEEHFNQAQGNAAEWHHSWVVQDKDASESDSSLRYVRNGEERTVQIAGEPALDPFGKGKRHIRRLASNLLSRGVPQDYNLVVAQMHLGSEFEGTVIGSLRDFAPTPQLLHNRKTRN